MTVAYEQHNGRRIPGQRSDGTLQLSVSRSTPLGMDDLMARWVEFAADDEDVLGIVVDSDPEVSGTDRRTTWRTRARDGSSVVVTSEPKKDGTASLVATRIGVPTLDQDDEARERRAAIVERFLGSAWLLRPGGLRSPTVDDLLASCAVAARSRVICRSEPRGAPHGSPQEEAMTTPSPKSSTAPDSSPSRRDRTDDAPREDAERAVGTRAEMEELARTRDEAEDRARELLAAQVLQESRNGSHDERARQLVLAVRRDLLVELREQEQQQARRRLAAAADSSEDAVTGLVHGMTTIVRSFVPAVLVRPEEVIETTYALADQSLRVARRMALVVTGNVRSLIAA